jgi:hypothetical protein
VIEPTPEEFARYLAEADQQIAACRESAARTLAQFPELAENMAAPNFADLAEADQIDAALQGLDFEPET